MEVAEVVLVLTASGELLNQMVRAPALVSGLIGWPVAGETGLLAIISLLDIMGDWSLLDAGECSLEVGVPTNV